MKGLEGEEEKGMNNNSRRGNFFFPADFETFFSRKFVILVTLERSIDTCQEQGFEITISILMRVAHVLNFDVKVHCDLLSRVTFYIERKTDHVRGK